MGENHIKEYFYQVWKRRKVVAIFAASVFVVTALVTFKQQRVYRAVTVIEIGAETPDVAFFQDVVNMSTYGWWSAMKYYETQYQILQSRALLRKVAQRAVAQGRLQGWTEDQITGHLQSGISVGTDEKSRLAKIYFDDSEPKRAMELSNLIADVFVDENLTQKLQGVERAVHWLNERLTDIREEKKRQEEELQKYKQEYKVVSLSDRENVAKANLLSLTESLNRIKSGRIEIEAQYRKLSELVQNTGRVDDLLGVVSSDLLTKLKHDLADFRTQKSSLAHRYMEKHPEMVRINSQISETEKAIRQEVSNEVSRLKTKFLLAKAEEEQISAAVETQKIEALRIDEVNRKLRDIQVVTDTNQEVFQTLQKKLKEADLSALVRSNNLRVVDYALEPTDPIRPNIQANLLMAILVGLLGGIGLALALEYLDDTLKTYDDVERYLKLPVLGMIPRLKPEAANGNGKGPTRIEFIPAEDPTSTAAEFYRTLRTNLLFLSATKGIKKIQIVSTGPGEGKTATAINLAVVLAQLGERTIIVDLDFRRPKLHYNFESRGKAGVTNVLLAELALKDAILSSKVPNLDYLVAGTIPPNPAELLGSTRLDALLEEITKRYDRVILDSSPVAPVTDAVITAQKADGVIVIVRASKTHRKAVIYAKDQLVGVSANLLGVVLNDVELEKATYGSYQYYKYGYSTYSAEKEEEPKESTSEPSLPSVAP